MKRIITYITLALLMSTPYAVAAADLPDKKRTELELYATPAEALALHDEGALFIDIRTLAEVSFVGIPVAVDRIIPYMMMTLDFNAEKGSYGLELNPYFGEVIGDELAARRLNKDHPIILMCRSGSRSAKAANLLAKLGYTNVYSLDQGFEGDKVKNGELAGQRQVNGWKVSGLEWSYSIRPGQEYANPEW